MSIPYHNPVGSSTETPGENGHDGLLITSRRRREGSTHSSMRCSSSGSRSSGFTAVSVTDAAWACPRRRGFPEMPPCPEHLPCSAPPRRYAAPCPRRRGPRRRRSSPGAGAQTKRDRPRIFQCVHRQKPTGATDVALPCTLHESVQQAPLLGIEGDLDVRRNHSHVCTELPEIRHGLVIPPAGGAEGERPRVLVDSHGKKRRFLGGDGDASLPKHLHEKCRGGSDRVDQGKRRRNGIENGRMMVVHVYVDVLLSRRDAKGPMREAARTSTHTSIETESRSIFRGVRTCQRNRTFSGTPAHSGSPTRRNRAPHPRRVWTPQPCLTENRNPSRCGWL